MTTRRKSCELSNYLVPHKDVIRLDKLCSVKIGLAFVKGILAKLPLIGTRAEIVMCDV